VAARCECQLTRCSLDLFEQVALDVAEGVEGVAPVAKLGLGEREDCADEGVREAVRGCEIVRAYDGETSIVSTKH